MPSISRIRFTNIIYDNSNKRYLDTTFRFDGYNGILLLENGAGKTVFVQTALQAVLPRKTVAQRKIQETLLLNNNIAHIAIEWILSEQPRRYALTAVSLFMNTHDTLASQEFAMEYTASSPVRLDTLPFTHKEEGRERPATKEETASWYRSIAAKKMTARFFSENDSLLSYYQYLEENFKIIASEWNKIASINETEGGVEAYFENCHTTNELVDRLLIPTIEEGCTAASGKEKNNGFVELFEKQREHFKKQRILQKRIEEMKKVIAELSLYTNVRHDQYKAENTLLDINRTLKAWYQMANTVQTQRQEQQELLQKQEQTLLQKQNENAKKREAWQVTNSQSICQEKKAVWQTVSKQLQTVCSQCDQAALDLANLRFARCRQEQLGEKQRKEMAEQELSQLAQNADAASLKQALEKNSAFLHDCFLRKEQAICSQKQQVAQHKQELTAQLNQCQQELKKSRQEKEQNTAAIGEKTGVIHTLYTRKEKLEQELFPDSLHYEPQMQYQRWQKEQQHITASIAGYQKNISFYTEEKEKTQTALLAKKQNAVQLETDLQALALQINQIDSHAALIIDKLNMLPACANTASATLELYQREEYISNQISDVLLKEEEKDKSITRSCRKAHRFLDMYDTMDQFTADPVLEEKIETWQPQYPYLRSGADVFREYCRNGMDAEKLLQCYPFWAATVITTADSTASLFAQLQKTADEFTYPVFILTDQELRSILTNTYVLPQQHIVPSYWHFLLPESFSQWMQTLKKQAESFDIQEKQHNLTLQTLRQTRQDLLEFYHKNTFAEYQELCSSQHTAQEQASILKKDIQQGEDTIRQCANNIEKFKQQIFTAKEQLLVLQRQCSQAAEYFTLQKQHQHELQLQSSLRQQEAQLTQHIETLENQQAAQQETCRSLDNEITTLQTTLQNMTSMLYYNEVQAVCPQSSVYTYEVLTEKRRYLKNRLDGIQQSRIRFEKDIEFAQKNIQRLSADMQQLQEDSPVPLDISGIYPENGKDKEQELQQLHKKLCSSMEQIRTQHTAAKEAFDQANGAYQSAKKRYFEQYDSLVEFTDTLLHMQEQLAAEKKQLAKALQSCRQGIKENQSQLNGFLALQSLLEKQNVRLQFTIPAVTPVILPHDQQSNDYIFLEKNIQPILKKANETLQVVDDQKLRSQKKKDEFIRYCEKTLQNEKMRRHIVDGIRSKETYEEFLTWKQKSTEDMQKIITICESERKEHYTHIEHMISFMASHLQEICKGLLEIAAKTRIKVNSGTKQIYSVYVPEWKDSENRIALREYLNSITDRLESAEYKDESGREDTKKIRQALEKFLRTQQILSRILGSNTIKVKCRKATSTELFADRPYSWEASNKWSGGEMWSKNMALFLGCLNYLAEKRCHIKKTTYNTRVVIADNPFGKASSDHILDPVFFIAQQLGFQIIALTAHEDGNFIRKYFPVVYSCRFANLANGKGKVLQPEKEIRTAFFEEHHPESLARLNEYEEMGLFE